MASTNRAVISAACHQPLSDDQQAYMFPVKWSVVSQDKDGIEHCSFTTARDVGKPIEGNLYL